jgi:hypothetical protein
MLMMTPAYAQAGDFLHCPLREDAKTHREALIAELRRKLKYFLVRRKLALDGILLQLRFTCWSVSEKANLSNASGGRVSDLPVLFQVKNHPDSNRKDSE